MVHIMVADRRGREVRPLDRLDRHLRVVEFLGGLCLARRRPRTGTRRLEPAVRYVGLLVELVVCLGFS